MTYIIYADVLFGYHVLIHLALFFMISAILWQTIRITRTILWALLTAALSTGVFLITINLSTILYYLLYAITYFIMTYFFTKSCCFEKPMLVCVGITVFCCIWLAGMMELFHFGDPATKTGKYGMLTACIGSVFLCRMIRSILIKKQIVQNNAYAIRIVLPGMEIKTQGFLDTGNRLYNPYTKKPVIVLDYRLLKSYLSKDSYKSLEYYHKTGEFPYEKLNVKGELTWFPLPYSTIRDKFALMPACTIQTLIFCESGAAYRNVTAGISKEPFMDKEQYRVLLHEGLNPNRRNHHERSE